MSTEYKEAVAAIGAAIRQKRDLELREEEDLEGLLNPVEYEFAEDKPNDGQSETKEAE